MHSFTIVRGGKSTKTQLFIDIATVAWGSSCSEGVMQCEDAKDWVKTQ